MNSSGLPHPWERTSLHFTSSGHRWRGRISLCSSVMEMRRTWGSSEDISRSSGRQPSESSVYADIEAAFTYLRDVRRVPWEQIIAYGRSIGTAPSIHLATMTPVRGLILQSPMTSIFRIPFRLRFTLPGDVFSNIDKIGNVCCPVFVIHGTRDEIVPCWHGQALHDACVKKGTAFQAYVVEGGDHNDLERFAADTFNDRFRHFLQHLKDTPVHDRLRSQAEIPTNLPLVDSLHPASGRTNNRA
eukprot:TRINITY_DN104443_c0_g1_i2.p1 TRINITY_DN104443_c0_g1~~TRINITY_DN104443_c0_g1_i2.p1  ORF type:complete len:243 (-),score=16.34 TRINITY_DN104443_c0_g1_i2:45-773(-)